MLIQDVFALDVTRDIAPVVYFHEKSPAKVLEEVSEYIVTGGYPENDPRHQRIPSGIHEQMVRLLKGIAGGLRKSGGTELPSAWISGFYGSGKSSFAKLLGLALDGLLLPDGRELAEALMSRDDSPLAAELRAAWQEVRSKVDPLAVVFDIGAVARDDEQIHTAAKREIQKRLGYSSISNYVADYELKLEQDGRWAEFLACAEETLGEPWFDVKDSAFAEDQFSQVLHKLMPDLYQDPMSWIDSRAGVQTGIGTSVEETTRTIIQILDRRAVGKTLFIVVDEVSQYIRQNDNRMLKLQSFVSDLGQKLKGRVWLFATGQQKLEENDTESTISKLKDRFPPNLRVHLAPTNIRDVVHKRLLKKTPAKEAHLRQLFQSHRSDLKLYGYGCESITEEDFLEVYPLLPGHVDLLMQITSNLRVRSTRVKGDDYAIRGLLQLLGEMFREQKLGEQPLGTLVTLERIYEVQQSALDADAQNTLTRLFAQEEVANDPMALRVAKAVALLELVQETMPTTAVLVGQCLYERLGMGNQEPATRQALEKLRSLGLLAYSEKTGYKIQSSAGQEWQRERDTHSVMDDEVSEIVSKKLRELVGGVERPRYRNRTFPWFAYYSDSRQRKDERILAPNDEANLTLDFQYQGVAADRSDTIWVQRSDAATQRERLLWVVGRLENLSTLARDLARSRHIVNRYEQRAQSLTLDRQRLLYEEMTRRDQLEEQVKTTVARVFMDGELYFRGRKLDKQRLGSVFGTVLNRAGEEILPDLYPHYIDIAVTPTELTQLLEHRLSGPSQKFMGSGLGILELDAGKYAVTCTGIIPVRIKQYIEERSGVSGSELLNHFSGPPYGHPADVVKACLAGLLRAKRIRIRPEAGPEITSTQDPGTRDLFQKDRDIKKADILPPENSDITARDLTKICKFFQERLSIELDRENDAIADKVFEQFPGQKAKLTELQTRYNRLPGRPELPDALNKLQTALEECMRSREVQKTVRTVKKNLDILNDGIQQLGILSTDLNDGAINALRVASEVIELQASQLREVEALTDIQFALDALSQQLESDRPWRDLQALEPQIKAIKEHYASLRGELIDKQEEQAREIEVSVRRREGFAQLKEDRAQYVLTPIRRALDDTTPTDIRPSLLQLRDSARLKLEDAGREANRLLNKELSVATNEQVIDLSTNLSGTEVSTPQEVEQLLQGLRDRILAQLKPNTRIRLV
jgi:Family of unknown function (DUF6079)